MNLADDPRFTPGPDSRFRIHQGDALAVLRTMPDASVHCCITSPPYWGLRDYGTASWEGGDIGCDHIEPVGTRRDSCGGLMNTTTRGTQAATHAGDRQYRDTCRKCGAARVDQQLGLERTPAEYVEKMVGVFREVRRVLRGDGTLWLNLGDSYSSGGRSGHGTRVGYKQSSNRGANDQTSPIRAPNPPGTKPKDLCGIPWRVALALQADGWYWRDCIVWHKPAPMPESVRDRCTKAWEPIFMLAKSERYYFDADAIKEPASYSGPNSPESIKSPYGQGFTRANEPASHKGSKFHIGKTGTHQLNRSSDSPRVTGNLPGRDDGGAACNKSGQEFRNKRNVWTLSPMATPDAHFATFPLELPETCLRAGCPEDGGVLDPFAGAGTTGLACLKQNRNFIGIELNPAYIEIAYNRARKYYPLLMASWRPPALESEEVPA